MGNLFRSVLRAVMRFFSVFFGLGAAMSLANAAIYDRQALGTAGMIAAVQGAIAWWLWRKAPPEHAAPSAPRGLNEAAHPPGDGAPEPATPPIATWRIRYSDAQDNASERVIRIHSVKPNLGQVYAWCTMRNAMRTFRIDRMRQAVDLDTGEIIVFDDWIKAYRRSRRQAH